MNDHKEKIMTTQEVVDYLRVSRKTVLKLIKEGKLSARKVGKDYRYLKSEIDRYLKGEERINYFTS